MGGQPWTGIWTGIWTGFGRAKKSPTKGRFLNPPFCFKLIFQPKMFAKVALACLAGAAQAAVPSDKIASLPGWPQSEQVRP